MENSIGQIYTGPWINYSRGYIRGSTVTLNARDGGLLTSFLAGFVTFVASRLWDILSFIIHQIRATTGDEDGLFHQHQIVFRNTSSPTGAALTFLRQAWAWRRRTSSPFLRSIPWALFAIIYAVVFALLSIFSSEVSKAAGEQRLVRPGNCGYWTVQGTIQSDYNKAVNAYSSTALNDSTTAAAYARQCYAGTGNNLECSTFPKSALTYSIDVNASCPFASEMCLQGETAAFSVDTGLLDSRDDLGINTPDFGRVQFRKVNTCAPLRTKGFMTVMNDTNFNSQILYYNFGSASDVIDIYNYTFMYNTATFAGQVGYDLSVVMSDQNSSTNAWFPIPELNRTDADVTLMFVMSNSIYYDVPNTDPLFSATLVEDTLVVTSDQNVTIYTSNSWVTVLGCVEQYQFCNPLTGNCTPLSHSTELLGNTYLHPEVVTFNDQQTGAIQRISLVVLRSAFYAMTAYRRGAALRVQDTVSNLRQGALPNNQWQIEVQGWFDTSLAALQNLVLEYATGPQFLPEGSSVWLPETRVSHSMCHSQLVRYTNSTISFSVLGMAIILVVGCLIIFISFVMEPIAGLLSKFGKGERYRHWILDDNLQVQRQLFESHGLGGEWSGDDIPTTTYRGVKFPRRNTENDAVGTPLASTSKLAREYKGLNNGEERAEQTTLLA